MQSWIPFIGPAPGVARWWWLLVVPMAFLISMAWKAVRQDDLGGYWKAVARMGTQVVLGMIGLFAFMAFFLRVIVPMMPAE